MNDYEIHDADHDGGRTLHEIVTQWPGRLGGQPLLSAGDFLDLGLRGRWLVRGVTWKPSAGVVIYTCQEIISDEEDY